MTKPTIICTVTNDLDYDQRMQRICTALAQAGYSVLLIGRALPHSLPLEEKPYARRRLKCRFQRGFPFYAEYNLRLFFYLLRAEFDAVCSIDLDTLPAGCLAGLLRRKKRVFDAHEYFTEVPEVTHRVLVKSVWGAIARIFLRCYRHAYTVGPALAAIFEEKYGLPFAVVRNVPALHADALPLPAGWQPAKGRILLYQGALNESRGIEQTLRALQQLHGLELWLAGEGDRSDALRRMAVELGVQDKVRFLGRLKPAELRSLTKAAWLGLNVLENNGLSYYYSLSNKFFDYVQAGVPVLTMDFPEYRALNARHEVALLLDRLTPEKMVAAVQFLVNQLETYRRLQRNTQAARLEWNWEREQATLLQVWESVFKD